MRWLILSIIFITAVSLFGIFFIIFFTAPQTKSGQFITINLFYFFLSSFVSLAGIATLVLYWLSNLKLGQQRRSSVEAVHRPKALLRRSARQAILFSGAVTAIWVLNIFNFVNLLNIILIISAAILIEIYFFGH